MNELCSFTYSTCKQAYLCYCVILCINHSRKELKLIYSILHFHKFACHIL